MLKRPFIVSMVLAVAMAAPGTVRANFGDGLQKGAPDLKSAGALAFGPDGILFVGDSQGAAIFAIDTGDRSPSAASGPIHVPRIGTQIASLLGTTDKDITLNGLAVNPASGNAYLSVSRG